MQNSLSLSPLEHLRAMNVHSLLSPSEVVLA